MKIGTSINYVEACSRMNTQLLNPVTFPLKGVRIIDASAGTGKTYTTTLLYLRLVLGHGKKNAFSKPLLPSDILVVTFTKAATQELAERIRSCLVEAAECFRGKLDDDQVDPNILAIRDEIQLETSLSNAAAELEIAAEWMDQAMISTIHGWCSRVLSEHAFQGGLPFKQELIENEQEILTLATEDYWREYYMPMDKEKLSQVFEVASTPEDLMSKIKYLVPHYNELPATELHPSAAIDKISAERDAKIKELKKLARRHIPILISDFAAAESAGLYSKRSLNAGNKKKFFDALTLWANQEDAPFKIDPKSATFKRVCLNDTALWVDGCTPPIDNESARFLAELPQALESLPSYSHYIVCHAAKWVAIRLAELKTQKGLISQDDLLLLLDKALQSENGPNLAARIRKQLPVAMIDEFQDTDPIQFRIFNYIYNIKEPYEDTSLIMIGDPKQAIYGFRGADIYTYLEAREMVGDENIFTLSCNYRSNGNLIKSVNGLFSRSESLPNGAFGFANGEKNPIPFLDVDSGSKAKNELIVNGHAYAPQAAWLLDETVKTKGAYVEGISQHVANEIANLLSLSLKGDAVIDMGSERPIRLNDFAILVNNRHEADAVRSALKKSNIPSVYLSDSDSVFTTSISDDLLQVMKSIANPNHDGQLRLALSTPLVGWTPEDLDRLNDDELLWDTEINRFTLYRDIWSSQGFMQAMFTFINDRNSVLQLSKIDSGERTSTDFLHLCEALQNASQTVQGIEALIRHYEDLKSNAVLGLSENQQRLESDFGLVQVITIHKSKGLQFPIVFLPFPINYRPINPDQLPIKYHDKEGKAQLAFDPTTEILELAEIDRKNEDKRKLYVALTRAICCQFIGLYQGKDVQDSGIGLLLNTCNKTILQSLNDVNEFLPVLSSPEEGDRYIKVENTTPKAVKTAAKGTYTNWWTSSYSAIAYGKSTGSITDEINLAPLSAFEDQVNEFSDSNLDNTDGQGIHGVPSSAKIGSMFHKLIQWASNTKTPSHDEVGFSLVGTNDTIRESLVDQATGTVGLETHTETISNWFNDFINKDLSFKDSDGAEQVLSLKNITPSNSLVECEFNLGARNVRTSHIDALISAQTFDGAERPVLTESMLNGILLGFIDLITEINGKYYLIDWKSNLLGRNDESYTLDTLTKSILKERYDLQYILYSLALHRKLKQSLQNYDYDTHFGGAIYAYLRGSNNSDTNGLFHSKPPKSLIEELDLAFG